MAKTNISQWDTTAGNNLDLNGISVAEGWLPSTVNNFEREEISQLAKFYDDVGGQNTVAGSAAAITVTTTTVYTALAAGMRLLVKIASDSTGATTLNLDAIGAKAVRKIVPGSSTDVALVAGDLRAGMRADLVYDTTLNSAAGGWLLLSPHVPEGTSTNDAAGAGQIGQVVESTLTSGSAVSLTTATAADVTSISVTAGDWEVSGHITFNTASTTNVSKIFSCLSTSSGALGNSSDGTMSSVSTGGVVPGSSVNAFAVPVGPVRMSFGGTITVYLEAQANFTVSTLTAYGHIKARRVR